MFNAIIKGIQEFARRFRFSERIDRRPGDLRKVHFVFLSKNLLQRRFGTRQHLAKVSDNRLVMFEEANAPLVSLSKHVDDLPLQPGRVVVEMPGNAPEESAAFFAGRGKTLQRSTSGKPVQFARVFDDAPEAAR